MARIDGEAEVVQPDTSTPQLPDQETVEASRSLGESSDAVPRDLDPSVELDSLNGTPESAHDNHEDVNSRLLIIENSEGKSFMVPWSECDTWEKLKVVLEKRLPSANKSTRERIKSGKFLMKNGWDAAYGPEYWHFALHPLPPLTFHVNLPGSSRQRRRRYLRNIPVEDEELDEIPALEHAADDSSHTESDIVEDTRPQRLLIHAKSETSIRQAGRGVDLENSAIDERAEVNYEGRIKYTVDYFRKERHGWDLDYLHSFSSDKPIIQGLWRVAKFAPVLEEKHAVRYPRNRVIPSRHLRPSRMYGLDPDMPVAGEGQADEPDKLETGDEVDLPSVQIHSKLLLNALGAVANYWTTSAEDVDDHRRRRDEENKQADNLRAGIFNYPFRDLYYHKKELIDYKDGKYACCARHPEAYQRECGKHIDLLIEYLYEQPDIGLAQAEAGWARQTPTTNFASFWLLLKPGTDVYVRKRDILNLFVVDTVDGGVEFSGRGQVLRAVPYTVSVWGMWFDGEVISRISKTITVPVFDSDREITSLPLFPAEFQDTIDGGATRERLLKRGQKFFKCCKGPAYMEYTGLGHAGRTSKHVRARVVIDHFDRPWTELSHNLGHACEFGDSNRNHRRSDYHSSYSSWDRRDVIVVEAQKPGASARSPRCECVHCVSSVDGGISYPPETHSDYDNIVPSETDTLTNHQYLLCWDQMFGFILKDRNYDLLDVEYLVEPQLSDDAIESLVLRPESNKDAIKALVKTYTDQASQTNLFSADFIQNKGEGQVILLHGPPGTGKTLTAESVAEFTRKPLVSITAADLGHEPQDLERNLTRFLKNAHIWNAVVLLDEADIYLQRRSSHDLKRNSIVSIFLRLLDYFQGILFLTSNRVGQIDEAFMSRIHIALGYRPLDDDARAHIWDALFRKLQDDYRRGGARIEYEYDAKQYVKRSDEVRTLQWNGREIRNAFQTVVALATFDAKNEGEKRGKSPDDVVPEIRESHLRQVVAMSAAFRKYMTSTHEGMEDPDHAFRLGNRDDRFYQGSGD
ncbi:uncharacterized protein HMPREF1541_00175 [Cyphellophora europaea CBS 101466]|uniref:AAA+ ATPase domain-containing protein n=1 Tax=Cyphellophora europaea (strain CBS 101466) TaxID=1220924 RepID=W2SBB6_CYPE1|nr:uncharacterized protein HMPREF1541_00175 [Cyphellophora europaea CBS 101466]ETN45992.1 hypothetical protein HMPREF1541_00175 [Cyphellophora europaea CBS 101466]